MTTGNHLPLHVAPGDVRASQEQLTHGAAIAVFGDAAFETALKGQFDDEREAVESILQSALNILERTSMGSGAGLIGKP